MPEGAGDLPALPGDLPGSRLKVQKRSFVGRFGLVSLTDLLHPARV